MTTAVISGQARTALLNDGGSLFSFNLNTPEILEPRSESDFHFLFGGATDARFLENVKPEGVLSELRADYYKTCALDLALMLFDKDISDTKPLIADALEDLLDEDKIIIYLDSIFYAKPLPASADTENAASVCRNRFSKTFDWLSALLDNQENIIRVRTAWDGIAADVFGSEQNRADFQNALVRETLFREIVVNCGDYSKIGLVNMDAMMNKSIASLPNHRAVLQTFFASFTQPRVSTEQISALKETEARPFTAREREPRRIDRRAVQGNVQRQVEYITDALEKNDLAAARRLTAELTEYQSSRGEPIHLVKSLCQLAQNAKGLGFYEFQLELTERAVSLEYSDSWTQAQYGDALLRNNRFEEALKTFEVAITFLSSSDVERNAVVRSGYGEVLKAQGNLDEALKVYEETMKSHPENVVVRNGYAEVLKAQGNLNEALKIYQETIKSHPEDAVARNGLCGVLLILGRYDEALDKLPIDNIKSHDDWVGYHIRGMIMLKTGNLAEAAKIFAKGEKEDPIPASREYWRSALAITRLRQRQFRQAGELLDKISSPILQPAVNIFRAHAFGELKMYPQAAAAFRAYENAPISKKILSYQRQHTLELVSEVNSRYVAGRVRTKPDGWLFDREEELLLALAP